MFIIFFSYQSFGQERINILLKTLLDNKMISDAEKSIFLKDQNKLENPETIRRILLAAPNTLHLNFEKDFLSTGKEMFIVTLRKISNKFFKNDSLNIKDFSIKPYQLNYMPYANEIHANIQINNFNYQISLADYFTQKNTNELNNLAIFDVTTDIDNFGFFNDFLLDQQLEERIFKITSENYPNEVFYIKINNSNYKVFKDVLTNDAKFSIKGGDYSEGFNLDPRYNYNNLNKLIDEVKSTDLLITKTNEEIIKNIRKNSSGNYYPQSFIYSLLEKNQLCFIESGVAKYPEDLKNPFTFILKSLVESSNGHFNVENVNDNILRVQQNPFIENRKIEVSFTYNKVEFKHNWVIPTMPSDANKEYLDENNQISILFKDVVNMVNEALRKSNSNYQYYFLQQNDGYEPPNTVVLLNSIQYNWFLKNFSDIFWNGIYPIK